MNKEILYKNNQKLTEFLYFDDSQIWRFKFGNSIFLDSSSYWRMTKNKKIVFTSLDHNQIFGQPTPKNLVIEVRDILKKKSLVKIYIDKDTGDLYLLFEDNIFLEFFTSSIGYESWNLHIEKKQFICIGGGEIVTFE